MVNLAHLAHIGPRASLVINQGLLQLGHKFDVDRSYRSKGKIIKDRSHNILKNISDYDFIICGNPIYKNFINELDIWNKVIWYDYGDSYKADKESLSKCLAYFKRSLVKPDRTPATYLKIIYPLDYCVLEEYLTPCAEKKVDISCLFDSQSGSRRTAVVQELQKYNFNNCLIGKPTIWGSEGRNAINKLEDTLYQQYLKILSQSKIVFTAFPQNHDGDSRTWEAFASGALVFRDITFIKSDNEPQDMIHYCCFDAGDKSSITEAIEKARHMLNYSEEREKIARNGFQLARDFHMAKNRVAYLLKTAANL